MKKLILFSVFMLTAFAVAAQTGSWYIGGVVSYASETQKAPAAFGGASSTSSTWAFGPEFGTFLKDDIQLGLYLGISGLSGPNPSGPGDQNFTSLSPTIYSRKFWKVTDDFSVFAGLYLSYISSTNTFTNPPAADVVIKTSGFGARVGIGVAYALSPRFTAVGQYGLLGFQSVSETVDGTDNGSTSNFDFGVNTIGFGSLGSGSGVFNIGIYYTLKTAN